MPPQSAEVEENVPDEDPDHGNNSINSFSTCKFDNLKDKNLTCLDLKLSKAAQFSNGLVFEWSATVHPDFEPFIQILNHSSRF